MARRYLEASMRCLRRLLRVAALASHQKVPAPQLNKHFRCLASQNLEHSTTATISTENTVAVSEAEERWKGSNPEDADHEAIIASLSASESRLLKILQLEYDVWSSLAEQMPKKMTAAMWLKMLFQCRSPASRKRVYLHWAQREKLVARDVVKKAERFKVHEERLQLYAERQAAAPGGQLQPKNTFNLFVRPSTMARHYNAQIAHAAVHGSTLVFDCAHEHTMNERELKNLARQLTYCHGFNKISREPFYFHLGGLAPGGRLAYHIKLALGDVETVPIDITTESYLERYPRGRLVYLSPNARKTMESFDHDAVYIIGAIVDLSNQRPLTMAKAKREGIKTVKLPLDTYLNWRTGSKNLTVDNVLRILLELKVSGNWHKALSHVSRRKVTRN